MNIFKYLFSQKVWILLGCFIVSSALYWNVSSLYDNDKIYSTSSSDAVYVLEDIDIDFRYDKDKYEVVPFINKPYVVIKGDKATINKMNWSKEEPYFFIDLTGRPPGTYQEVVHYDNIPSNLTVEIYPLIVDLRIMEQQTISFTPQIELQGVDNLGDNYIVSVPELQTTEVKVKGMQEVLNNIGTIKGVVDIAKRTTSFDTVVELKAYDRDGNPMPEVNLIEKLIKVHVPITKKVTIVNEQVVQEIVVVEQPKEEEPTETGEEEPNTEKPTKPIEPPKQIGILSFVNVTPNYKIENLTPNLTWTSNLIIDLKGFELGTYEMTLKDQGVDKVLKFRLYTDEPPKEPVVEESPEDKANSVTKPEVEEPEEKE